MWDNKKILQLLNQKFSFIIGNAKQIIDKFGIIPKEDKIIFIDENNKSIYSIKDSMFYPDDLNFKNVKKCVISDSLVELKVIVVPVVSNRFLRNIVINTIKKHSTVLPSIKNIDFKILNEEEKHYEILVFIKHYNEEDDLFQKKMFTTYHIMDNLMKDGEFPDNASFLTKNGKIWFLYKFKDRKFKRRDIYFQEDLQSFKKGKIYYLNLFSKNDAAINKNLLEISKKKQQIACLSLKKGIFREKQILNPKIISIFSIAFILFSLALTLEIINFRHTLMEKEISKEMNKFEELYNKEKAKRGISDELYKEYLIAFSKKSNVNEFFYNLYFCGKNNIMIQRLFYDNKKFTISGYCIDDSRLEDLFRKSSFWKKINFSFSKKRNTINFTINGEFIHE